MVKTIPLDQITDNPFQSRVTYDAAAVQSLADEIKAEGFWNGTLQGRKTKNGKVELVFGHRRLRALRKLKVPSVQIELLDLTDAQMALRSLEENLQREGLTDLEKADAVKRAVEIAEQGGKNSSHAVTEVSRRLGLGISWVSELCEISSGIPEEIRAPIQAGYISAVTANRARKWGGDVYLRTLAKQGKQAEKDKTVSKPTYKTVDAMKKAVKEAPETIQERLKKDIVSGAITTPEQAYQKTRRLKAEQTKRTKPEPPDLRAVIIGWTHRLKDWEAEMKQVTPYMDYVEAAPGGIAKDFRAALKKLIDTAKDLL